MYACIPAVRWRQEWVSRRENDQYGNYAHSTVHDTFKFLSLNLHARAVSDIAIYTSRIELPNLHIQGHNCHFPEPSHLVAIQRTLLPLLSFISMTNCFNYQTVTSERTSHFFATDFVKNKHRLGRPLFKARYVVNCSAGFNKFTEWPRLMFKSYAIIHFFYSGALQPTSGLCRLVFTFLNHIQLDTHTHTHHTTPHTHTHTPTHTHTHHIPHTHTHHTHTHISLLLLT